MTRPRCVLFDMGSVLIGWDVRPPFRRVFDTDAALDAFLRGPFREIYDAVHDGDGSMADCLRPVRERHPHLEAPIDVYEKEWASFVTGVMPDSVAIVRELAAEGVPLYGVTNWPAQVWPPERLLPDAAHDFEFLGLFTDIWVSGEHRLRKPDPASYRSALARFGRVAEEAVFVDDLLPNVETARALGMTGLHFVGAGTLRADLERLGLLSPR